MESLSEIFRKSFEIKLIDNIYKIKKKSLKTLGKMETEN